jgi:hypothetical protein
MAPRFIAGLLIVLCLAGCERQSGQAIVIAKEHVAPAPPTSETPSAGSGASRNEISTDAAQPRPIGDNEIAVDGYIMKPDVRGTSRDPRALKEEQWIVKVRMLGDGRTFNVQAERAQFDKLREGDRVRVSYRLGKYTKTVWGAQIAK